MNNCKATSKTHEAIEYFSKNAMATSGKVYRTFLINFFKLVAKELEQVTFKDVIDFKQSISTQARTSQNWKVGTIKRFFQFAKNLGYIKDDPTVELKKIRNAQPKPFEIIDFRVRDNLLKVISGNSAQALRDKPIIYLLNEGLRVSEVCGLTFADLEHSHYGKPAIMVKGKGEKYRFVQLPDEGWKSLQRYIKNRQETSDLLNKNNNVFSTVTKNGNGEHIAPLLITHLLKKYCRKLGVKQISPHKLRHATASYLLTVKKWPLIRVRDYLGHSSISTTNTYLHYQPDGNEDKPNISCFEH